METAMVCAVKSTRVFEFLGSVMPTIGNSKLKSNPGEEAEHSLQSYEVESEQLCSLALST